MTADEMVDALRSAYGAAVADKVEWIFEDRIQKIVGTWPRGWNTTRALGLGMVADSNVLDLIRQYAAEVAV